MNIVFVESCSSEINFLYSTNQTILKNILSSMNIDGDNYYEYRGEDSVGLFTFYQGISESLSAILHSVFDKVVVISGEYNMSTIFINHCNQLLQEEMK